MPDSIHREFDSAKSEDVGKTQDTSSKICLMGSSSTIWLLCRSVREITADLDFGTAFTINPVLKDMECSFGVLARRTPR